MGYATQLRSTDLEALIRFYVDDLGYELDFRYEDFYAGINSCNPGNFRGENNIKKHKT